MEIGQFDMMASEDKGEYVGLLVGGAEQAFKDEGRADLAATIEELFTKTLPGDQITLGMVEFQRNLGRARVADPERVAKEPNAHRLEVEDAMLVTRGSRIVMYIPAMVGRPRQIWELENHR